jgi:hypothetical protein
VFNATIINISFITWWSVLIVEGTGETHWQTLSHNVVSSKPRLESELFPNLDNYYIYYIIIDTYHLLRPLYHEDVPGNVGLFQDNQTDLYFWVELSLYFWGVLVLLSKWTLFYWLEISIYLLSATKLNRITLVLKLQNRTY